MFFILNMPLKTLLWWLCYMCHTVKPACNKCLYNNILCSWIRLWLVQSYIYIHEEGFLECWLLWLMVDWGESEPTGLPPINGPPNYPMTRWQSRHDVDGDVKYWASHICSEDDNYDLYCLSTHSGSLWTEPILKRVPFAMSCACTWSQPLVKGHLSVQKYQEASRVHVLQ